ncbi:MAG TPA: hypothetical protein PLK12_07090 [Prolixibacteraceae bacterium]|nr:hypothetical protein [Prolixibacteraceae bacterium]
MKRTCLQKKKPAWQFLILFLSVVFFASCNPTQKPNKEVSPGNETLSDTFQLEKVKNQVVELIMEMNKAEDIVPMLNKAGASYIFDLTVPPEKAEKQLTRVQMSFFWGMVVFDMIYAKTYNRNDVLAKVSDLEYRFKTELGLTEALEKVKGYNQRIENNKENKDSLEVLFQEAMDTWFSELSESHLSTLVYSTIGNTVEALYVLTQLALLAEDNTELLAIVNGQREHLGVFFDMVDWVAEDKNVMPMYDDLSYIANLFHEKELITVTELDEMSIRVGRVRNQLVN